MRPPPDDEGRPGKGGPVMISVAAITPEINTSVWQPNGWVRCERETQARGSWHRYAGRAGTDGGADALKAQGRS